MSAMDRVQLVAAAARFLGRVSWYAGRNGRVRPKAVLRSSDTSLIGFHDYHSDCNPEWLESIMFLLTCYIYAPLWLLWAIADS